MRHATSSEVELEEEHARRLVERRWGPVSEVTVEVERLRGGLEAASVARVTARYRDASERSRSRRWVIKRIDRSGEREVAIHRCLSEAGARFVPEVIADERLEDGDHLLHVEWVRPYRRWPWRDLAVARRITRCLARMHRTLDARLGSVEIPGWDYEAELEHSAQATVRRLERLPADGALRKVRRSLPAARRLTRDLPELRRRLHDWGGPGTRWIHGDLHPSNVVVRTRDRRLVPVLLDWGRARPGSPLEDVSSWLLSLSVWEPKARRRHDRLLRDYLEAAGALDAAGSPEAADQSRPAEPPRLDDELRDLYWIAGACNALAGALRVQVRDALHAHSARARRDALAAAETWARALQRADVRLRARI